MSTATETKPRKLINISVTAEGVTYALPKTAADKLDSAKELLKAIQPALPAAMGKLAEEAFTAVSKLQFSLASGKVLEEQSE